MINDNECYDGWYYHQASLSDLYKVATDIIDGKYDGLDKYPGCLSRGHVEIDDDFVGASPLEAARQLVNGYHCKTPAMVLTEGTLSFVTPSPQADYVSHDVHGLFPDIGEYLSGNPECMVNFTPNPIPRRISLLLSVGANSTMKGRGFITIARHIVGLIRGLEDAGYQIKLDICAVLGALRTKNVILLPIKDYHDPMDGDLIEWMYSSQGYRWGWFALMDLYGTVGRHAKYEGDSKLPYTYGRGMAIEIGGHAARIQSVFGTYDLVLDTAKTSQDIPSFVKRLSKFVRERK